MKKGQHHKQALTEQRVGRAGSIKNNYTQYSKEVTSSVYRVWISRYLIRSSPACVLTKTGKKKYGLIQARNADRRKPFVFMYRQF